MTMTNQEVLDLLADVEMTLFYARNADAANKPLCDVYLALKKAFLDFAEAAGFKKD